MVSFVEPDSDEYYELQCTVSELIDEYISNDILSILKNKLTAYRIFNFYIIVSILYIFL